MKTLIKTLAAAGLVGSLAVPAFAQSDMTCEAFMAMDSDGQMTAMEEMEAMATEAEGTDAAPAAEMTEEETMAMREESMASVMTACEGDPSMMVNDAMMMGDNG